MLNLRDWDLKKYLPGFISVVFVTIAGVYSGLSSQLLYSAIFAVSAIILHMLHRDSFYKWFLEVISLGNIAYIIYEIFVNTIYYELNLHFRFRDWDSTNLPYSDAFQLDTLTKIPPIVWGVLWIIILILIFLMNSVFKKPAEKSDDD
jgi:hypothetical protein